MSSTKKQSNAGGSSQRKVQSSSRDGGIGAAAANSVDQPDEDPLVAVILADSYDDHFAPLTLSWPRCLLPIANVPLLHFSVESATRAGVSHIYILTRAHAQSIRQHVDDHLKVVLQAQGIAVTIISMPEALSEGDALRDLDAKQILRSDFLLYRADSVVTFDLKSIVQEHRQRRLADKDAIMTVCCMHASEGIAMRSKAAVPVHYVDSAKKQLLHYETLNARLQDRATLPIELLQLNDRDGSEEIEIRHDLVEAGVYICSLDVPPLFSENFDYQSLHHDFIPGILTSDLLESKIFLHAGKRGYGGRAEDTQTYDSISRDILRHWTSPIYPGSNSWIGTRFTEKRGWRYIGEAIQSDRSSRIGPCSLIGSRCSLGENVTILESVLCDDVKIGKGSKINRSHLHNSVSIGANVTMSHCIIGRGARILDNVQLSQGCLVGADCIVGPDVKLPAGTRVGLRGKESWDDEDTGDVSSETDSQYQAHDTLGSSARGVVWPNYWTYRGRSSDENLQASENTYDDDVSDDEDLLADIGNMRVRAFGYASVDKNDDSHLNDCISEASTIEIDSEFEIDEEDESFEEADEADSTSSIHKSHTRVPQNLVTNLTLDEEGDSQLEKQANEVRVAEFEAEARASLARALNENHSVDNASLELKTLRMASNVEPSDVQRIVVHVLLEQCKPDNPKQIQALISRWGTLLAHGAQEDELNTILHAQHFCARDSAYSPVFVPLLKLFYNEDLVSDETIIAWWRSKASQAGDEAMRNLRLRAQGVVRYILENEDDEESEEE